MNKPDIVPAHASSAWPVPAPEAVAGSGVAGLSGYAGPVRPSAGRIAALQYLRAIAALMVVGYHASHYLAYFRKPAGPIHLWESSLGMWGVALFFALSGYLMARLAPVTPPGRFLLHRVARIYPVYFVAIAVFFALSPVIVGHVFTPRFLPSTLVPVGPAGYTLGVEWTLLYELTFYVFIFLLIAGGQVRAIPGVAIGWIALVIGWRLAFGEPASLEMPVIYQLPASSANIGFACGLLVPAVTRRLRVHPAWMLAGLGVLLLDIGGVIPADRTIAGAVSALMIAAALGAQPSGGGLAGRIGISLGDASYAIYLVHVPVLVAVFRWLPAAVPLPAAWCVAFIAAVLVGQLFGAIDLRMYQRLKRRIDALGETRALRLAWVYAGFFAVIASWGAATHLIDQRQSDRAAAALGLIASNGALDDAATPKALNARLAAADRGFTTPRGAIDQTQRLPDDKIAVQGWAIDLARPDVRAWIAVYCDGRQIGWAERTRLRRAEAAQLAAETGADARSLAKTRFGFTLATQASVCPAGARLTVIAADAGGRAFALPAATAP